MMNLIFRIIYYIIFCTFIRQKNYFSILDRVLLIIKRYINVVQRCENNLKIVSIPPVLNTPDSKAWTAKCLVKHLAKNKKKLGIQQ